MQVALPGVGENFHNHVLTGVIRECTQPVPHGQAEPLGGGALLQVRTRRWSAPDLQIAFVHVPFNIIVGQGAPELGQHPAGRRPPALARLGAALERRSAGASRAINPNYLAAKADRDRLVQAVRLAREIFATRAFSGWVGEELMPGPDVSNSDEDLLRVRAGRTADSYHHQAGSCRMGLDEIAVVDPRAARARRSRGCASPTRA